ncbi:TATA-box-binding protein [Halorussus marinus]|uniref:TATA-box-binding protein n=1 Tax=Halorussus marinus TaxID=2505976 RepID=UPI001091AA2A|nr:transcription factor [Halorussus marinus]
MTDVELANIVGILDFHRELNLEAVAELLESSSVVSEVNYSPEENHWLQTRFRFNEGSKYVAFYRSGTCALVGCSSFEQLNQLVELVENAMEPVIRDTPSLDIKNLVCVGELSQKLNLTHLAIAAGLEHVEYEPEQFPGLIYRGNESDPVFLVFASGKVVITGATSRKEANQSFQDFTEKLVELGLRD